MSSSRSFAAVAASAAMHAVAIAGAVSLAKAAALAPRPRVDGPLTFFNIRVAPDPALAPLEPAHLPPLAVEPPRLEELPAMPIAPPPEPPVETPDRARGAAAARA